MFHTRFDYEKGVLKFYTDNLDYMKPASEKPINDTARSFEPLNIDAYGWLNENFMKAVAVIAVMVAIIFVFICLCKCCKNIFGKKKYQNAVKQSEMVKL